MLKNKKTIVAVLFIVMIVIIAMSAATSAKASGMVINKIATDVQSPQQINKPIVITVDASGYHDITYEFSVESDGSVEKIQAYSTSNTCVWTPTGAGDYHITVKIKENITWGQEKDKLNVAFAIYDSPVDTQPNDTYTIDLQKWGIDGDPDNNSNGINDALLHASREGYKKVVFPKQTYVISENIPINIINMRNMVIDFNDAVLKIRPSDMLKNKIIHFENCYKVNLVNGTLLGDRDEHIPVYHADGRQKTTEGNLGILIEGKVTDCEIDNLIIKEISGWGLVTSRGKAYTSKNYYISEPNFEHGSVNLTSGARQADATKVRTKDAVNVREFTTFEDKYFILGNDKGYTTEKVTKDFDVVFYDVNRSVISHLADQLQYKKIPVPANAVYADFVFHQPDLPTGGDTDFGGAITFLTHHMQTNILVKNTVFERCRSLGMAICGGDGMVVTGCTFIANMGLAPSAAVDLEDGWEYMHDIKFIDNTFIDNSIDIVVCAGDKLLLEGNKFSSIIKVYYRAKNYTITNNTFQNASLRLEYSTETAHVNNNVYIDSSFNIEDFNHAEHLQEGFFLENETFYDSHVTDMGEKPLFKNSSFNSSKPAAVYLSGRFENCTFDLTKGEIIGSLFTNCTFNRMDSSNNRFDTIYDNCYMKDSYMTFANNLGDLMLVKDCRLENSGLSTINHALVRGSIVIEDSYINITPGAAKSLVNFSGRNSGEIILTRNIINNTSDKPVLNMFGTQFGGDSADSVLTLTDNQFNQSTARGILGGESIAGGKVTINDKNNTYSASSLLDPIYNNSTQFFQINR